MLCIFFILERESSLRDIVSLPLCVSVIIFCSLTMTNWAFLVAQMVKNLPTLRETWVRSLGQEDPLEKGKAVHSSTLAWRISWTV